MKAGLAFLIRATTPADRLVLIAVWGGMILLGLQAFARAPGEEAVVRVRGEVVERLALDRPRTVTIQGALGPTELRIREGAIRFRHAPCQRKRCLRRGWLAQAGETAACVPNRVLVRVGGEQGKSWHAVSY